jgi:hypothetical protein
VPKISKKINNDNNVILVWVSTGLANSIAGIILFIQSEEQISGSKPM